jgi:Flp pilus assembly protein TadG
MMRGDRRSHVAGWAAILKGECGSGLVEYAVIFTIFMTMLLGVADFGRLMYAYHFVSNEAREATRFASVHGSTCTGDGSCTSAASPTNNTNGTCPTSPSTSPIMNFVCNVPLGIDPTEVSLTATWPTITGGPTACANTANAPGCTVRVQVSYAFSFAVPIVSNLVNGGSPITLTSTSQMVISH